MMEKIKEYFWYIIAVGLLLVMVNSCFDSIVDKYIGEGNVYEKQLHRKIELLNDTKRKTEKKVDSLHADNKKKDSIIAVLKASNKKIDKEIDYITKEKDGTLVQTKNYTYEQSAKFISKTYNMPKSISTSDKGVTLADSLPNKVVETIVEKDFLDKKLTLTEDKLDNTVKQNECLEEEVKNKNEEIKTISELSLQKDDVISASNDVNNNLKKQNFNLKTQSTINKVLLGISAVVIGILIIK